MLREHPTLPGIAGPGTAAAKVGLLVVADGCVNLELNILSHTLQEGGNKLSSKIPLRALLVILTGLYFAPV